MAETLTLIKTHHNPEAERYSSKIRLGYYASERVCYKNLAKSHGNGKISSDELEALYQEMIAADVWAEGRIGYRKRK